LPQLPRIMIWAGERPEKLDFINPRERGVDFLARTVPKRRAGNKNGRNLLRLPSAPDYLAA
jgi:hypothetical protein